MGIDRNRLPGQVTLFAGAGDITHRGQQGRLYDGSQQHIRRKPLRLGVENSAQLVKRELLATAPGAEPSAVLHQAVAALVCVEEIGRASCRERVSILAVGVS